MSLNVLTQKKNKRIEKMVDTILKNPSLKIDDLSKLLNLSLPTIKLYLTDTYIEDNYDITVIDTCKLYYYYQVEEQKLQKERQKLIEKKELIKNVVITYLNSDTKTLFEVGVKLNISTSTVSKAIHDEEIELLFSKKIKNEIESYLKFKDRDTNGQFARKNKNSLKFYVNRRKRKNKNVEDVSNFHYFERIISDISESNYVDYEQLIDLYNNNEDFANLVKEKIAVERNLTKVVSKEIKNGKTR